MVQNFVFFADRLGATRIRTAKFKNLMGVSACPTCNRWAWVWFQRGEDAKIKTTKFSSEGLSYNSAKLCTSENFLLYGILCACARDND